MTAGHEVIYVRLPICAGAPSLAVFNIESPNCRSLDSLELLSSKISPVLLLFLVFFFSFLKLLAVEVVESVADATILGARETPYRGRLGARC